MADSKKITISFPEEEEYLLEEVDRLVDGGVYENRTDAILDAISDPEPVDETTVLYDAAVSSFYSAERKGNEEIAENARQHIIDNFPGSRMADLLED